MLEHLNALLLFINDQAVSSLVECSLDDFVKHHLRKLLKDLIHGEANLLSDIVNLNFTVWLYYLLQVVLQECVVEICEMSLDDWVIKQLSLIKLFALFEH